jgi:glutathione S-transferase
MATTMTPPITRTLFIWPTGLYPRRLAYYFLAKRLSRSVLSTLNLTLIPCIKDPTTRKIVSKPGYESRPPGFSVPCLRLQTGDAETWIRESGALLEYFEDLLPAREGWKDLLGASPEQRARTRDVCDLVNEALMWLNVATRHSDPNAYRWSGLPAEAMAFTAAEDAGRQVSKLFAKLESWVKEDVGRGCMSLSGEGLEVSIADCSLLATVEYISDVSGYDCIGGFEVLKVWRERITKEDWYRDYEALLRLEREGLEGMFCGVGDGGET